MQIGYYNGIYFIFTAHFVYYNKDNRNEIKDLLEKLKKLYAEQLV